MDKVCQCLNYINALVVMDMWVLEVVTEAQRYERVLEI